MPVGKAGQLVVHGHELQLCMQLLAPDGGGELVCHEQQQVTVFVAVRDAIGPGAQRDHADEAIVCLEGRRQCAAGQGIGHGLQRRRQQVDRAGRQQDRRSAQHRFFAQQPHQRYIRLRAVVDMVGKVQALACRAAQGDPEAGGGQQLLDDRVAAREQVRQIATGMGCLGDGIQRRLHRPGLFQRGDIARDRDP